MLSKNDCELAQAAQNGDKQAFNQLIRQHHPMIERMVRGRITPSTIVQDVVQDVFLHAYLSLDTLRDPCRFRSWVYGIALNVCRQFWRNQRSDVLSLESLAGGMWRDDTPTPEELAERIDLRQMVKAALARLSETNREAVRLYYYEGFSQDEVATLLGISLSATKVRLHRAREQLKTYLQPQVTQLSHKPKEQTMIPVTIVDATSEFVRGQHDHPVKLTQVVLFDEADRRALVIWIGEHEGFAITAGLQNYEIGRPLTQVFMQRLLAASGAMLEAVEINKLENDVYYATAKLKVGDMLHEVDARPSDAMALAVHTKSPIFVAESVLDNAGVVVPKGKTAQGNSMEMLAQNITKFEIPPPKPQFLDEDGNPLSEAETARIIQNFPSADENQQIMIQRVVDRVFQ